MTDPANQQKRTSAFSIIVLFISVSLLGIILLPKLSVKLTPTRALPSIHIGYYMYGASARVVEKEVTSKVEAVMNRIKGIKNINSNSFKGGGSLNLEIDKHSDLELIRFEVSSAIRQLWTTLPNHVSYPSIYLNKPSQDKQSVMLSYMLSAPLPSIEIFRLTEDRIKQGLVQIKGVSSVEIFGYQTIEWRLKYNLDEWKRWGIGDNDVSNAIKQAFTSESLGVVSVENDKFIRLQLSPSQSESFDPTTIYIKSINGSQLRLDQVVSIERGEKTPHQAFRINGLNTLTLSVTPDDLANQIELSKIINRKIEEIQRTLPKGFKIQKTYDAAIYLNKELNTIYWRSGLTLLILLLFTILITRNWKYVVITITSLSVNLLLAFILYYLLKLEIQMYSLAGITISLSLLIDNTIVMIEHLRHKKSRRVILSIVAATLTSIAALAAIFFLDENTRLNLQDFAIVIVINLILSILVSLFFVPAMFDKLELLSIQPKIFSRSRRVIVRVNRIYLWIIRFITKRKGWVITIFVLLFGTPVFMLPTKLDDGKTGAKWYNATIGSKFYQEKLKMYVEIGLGGTWRLFAQKVSNGYYGYSGEETIVNVNLSMPSGSTFPQMDHVVCKVEQYISTFQGIRQFETQINNAQSASIRIYFNRKGLLSGLPYSIQSQAFSKASEYDGVSCSVTGKGYGFSNKSYESAGEYRIECLGYNYDELTFWTEQLRQKLLLNQRIKEVTIDSRFNYNKPDYREFIFDIDPLDMSIHQIANMQLFQSLSERYNSGIQIGDIKNGKNREAIVLQAKQSSDDDFWALNNHFNQTLNQRLSHIAQVDFRYAPQDIAKENQQYKLCLQYTYIGVHTQGERVLRRTVDEFNKQLPLGFSTKTLSYSWWDNDDKYSKYWMLLLIVLVIYMICSILFNSLVQPLIIISIIPISFIGLFLTFYLFKLDFDQGGFAALILLSGITVNSAIYIVDEFNTQRQLYTQTIFAFRKAINLKIISVFLTIISTILGFVPFLIGEERMAFWFPLAVGTIGGLIFSLIGLIFYLPLMLAKRKKIVCDGGDEQ